MATKRYIKKEKTTYRPRVLYATFGLLVWTLVSFAFIGIALENFGNEKNYLHLLAWIAVVLVGYAVLLYLLGVRRVSKEDDAST